MILSRLVGMVALLLAFQFSIPAVAATDEVLDWNTIAVKATVAVPGALQPRILAIVHVSMFDALNGIERRYVPIHVDSKDGPRNASRKAAVVQAAYKALITLLPAQAAVFESGLAESLSKIATTNSAVAIQRGLDWGDKVALAILTWRAADKTSNLPEYRGSEEVGKWRPTPPAFASMLAPLLGSSPTFFIPTARSFRPSGPPALTSKEYAKDVNEIKSLGALNSAQRTADQTQSARFWATSNPGSVWNRAASSASLRRHLSLSENARLFALLNVATADAIFACWDAKYHFSNWRPVHAIPLADTNSNPATTKDLAWLPLINTPPYPDYYSGHQSISRAAADILTSFFGKRMGFEAFSEGLPNVIRSWRSFSDAADEAFMARIWAGIHFRFAMRDGQDVSEKIARYVLKNAARPVSNVYIAGR